MFRFILALALALPLFAQADPGRRGHPKAHVDAPAQVVVDQRRVQRRLDAIDAEMDTLAALLATQPEPPRDHGSRRQQQGERHANARHQRAIAAQLAAVRSRVKALHRAMDEARPLPRPRPRRIAPQAMSATQFKRLKRSLDDARFRADKQAVLRRAVLHNHFTSAQARGIAREFTFSDDKVDALTALHPRVVDPENFEQVFSELTFSSARRQLDANIYASNDAPGRR